jgi:hypothetical protein
MIAVLAIRSSAMRGGCALGIAVVFASGCGGEGSRDARDPTTLKQARSTAITFGHSFLESPDLASAVRAAKQAGGTPIAEEVHDWYPNLKAREQLHVVSVSDGCHTSDSSVSLPAGDGPCFSLRLVGSVVPDRRRGYQGFGSVDYGTLFVRTSSDGTSVYDLTFAGGGVVCRLGHDCDSRERNYRKQPPDF